MDSILSRYQLLKEAIKQKHEQHHLSTMLPKLIAVSKRQSVDKISEAISAGQCEFGENQVQEAISHWQGIKGQHPNITLHLIGPLQSNKTHDAVTLFDVIHTVDREKIARAIKIECDKQAKNIPCFIQINIGEEAQKAGILPKELPAFLQLCRHEIGLNIIGLMAIPPVGHNPAPYFALMKKLAERHELPELSMGMSGDFETAIRFGATYIRVGTALFGARKT